MRNGRVRDRERERGLRRERKRSRSPDLGAAGTWRKIIFTKGKAMKRR
jgi:hypothetical protein